MIPFPEKKYSVIYADPPWNYAAGGKTRNVERHYRTMKPEDIYSLPVQDIAEDDCLLFLWATFPNLDVALETIRRWGFQYKTAAFVWVKRNRKSPSWFWGLGNWTRANAEICLLATKGKPKRASASVHMAVVWKTSDTAPLAYLIPSVFGELATATGFYFSKAKAENRIKLRKLYGPEIYNDTKEV